MRNEGGSIMDFKKAMEYAKGTHAIEGMFLTKKEEQLLERKHKGELSQEEYEKEALKLAYE